MWLVLKDTKLKRTCLPYLITQSGVAEQRSLKNEVHWSWSNIILAIIFFFLTVKNLQKK